MNDFVLRGIFSQAREYIARNSRDLITCEICLILIGGIMLLSINPLAGMIILIGVGLPCLIMS